MPVVNPKVDALSVAVGVMVLAVAAGLAGRPEAAIGLTATAWASLFVVYAVARRQQ